MEGRGPTVNIRTCRDLVAWQKGMALAETVCRETLGLPSEEKFGLTSQMEFRRFLEISRGSLFELQTHAELARRLGWLKGDGLNSLRDSMHELDAILAGLVRSVKARPE
jgi:hypothetical protein